MLPDNLAPNNMCFAEGTSFINGSMEKVEAASVEVGDVLQTLSPADGKSLVPTGWFSFLVLDGIKFR